jgi:hypothetical protein
LSCCCAYAITAASGSWHIVVVGGAGAVLVYAVAVVVCTGWAAGSTGVLQGSGHADQFSCCSTYTITAASGCWHIFVICNIIAVIIYAVTV